MYLTTSFGLLEGANMADQIDTFSAILGIISFVVVAGQWLIRGRDREAATRGDLKRVGSFVTSAISDQLALSITTAERLRLDKAEWLTTDQRDHIEANMLTRVSRAIDRALEGAGEQASDVAKDLLDGQTETAENVLERQASTGSTERASEALHLKAAVVSLHDIEQAIAACRRAIELEPCDAIGWSQLAHLYLRNGDLNQAQDAFENAITMKTAVPEPARGRIELFDIRDMGLLKRSTDSTATSRVH